MAVPFLLTAIIFIVGFAMFSLVYSSVDDRKQKKIQQQVQRRGTMYGVFYRLDNSDDLFIIKTPTYKEAKKLSVKLGYNLYDNIFYCQKFEELTNLKTNKENFYVKEIPENENPKPAYTNNGIQYN